MLVVVCGLPGVGKTTVSAEIAARIGATRLRSDVVRKELFPDPEYTDAEAWAVYRELVDRARGILERGDPVVLDATFHRAEYRDLVLETARDLGAELRVVKVECEDMVVRERIAAREGDASDATVEIYEFFRETYEPLDVSHVVVDNSDGLGDTRAQVASLFPGAEATPTQPVGAEQP